MKTTPGENITGNTAGNTAGTMAGTRAGTMATAETTAASASAAPISAGTIGGRSTRITETIDPSFRPDSPGEKSFLLV